MHLAWVEALCTGLADRIGGDFLAGDFLGTAGASRCLYGLRSTSWRDLNPCRWLGYWCWLCWRLKRARTKPCRLSINRGQASRTTLRRHIGAGSIVEIVACIGTTFLTPHETT